MVEQAKNGLKVDKSFKSTTLTKAAKAVSDEFGIIVTYDNAYNHYRTLKSRWNVYIRLKNMSGTGWNEDEKIVVFEGHEYTQYIKDHPKDEPYLNKPLVDFDNLSIICRSNQATGYGTRDSGCSLGYNPNNATSEWTDFVLNSQPVLEDLEIGDGSQDPPPSTEAQHDGATPSSSSKRSKKSRGKHAKVDLELQMMQDVADNLGEIAKAMMHKQDVEQDITNTVWSELMQLVEFTNEEINCVYDYLICNMAIARGFLVRSSKQRVVWISSFLRRFGPSSTI